VRNNPCGVNGSSPTYLRGKAFGKLRCPVHPLGFGGNFSILDPLYNHILRLLLAVSNPPHCGLMIGPIANRFGPRVIYDSGLTRDATVASIIRGSNLCLPITQTLELNEIRDTISSLPNPNHEIKDKHKWKLNSHGEFTISSLWRNSGHTIPRCLGTRAFLATFLSVA